MALRRRARKRSRPTPRPCQRTACSSSTPTTRSHGVRHAVEVGRALRERGHEMLGIRLDSGDLLPRDRARREDPRRRRASSAPRSSPAAIWTNTRSPPQATGRTDRHLGRRHAPGHGLRPTGPRRHLQAGGHPIAGRRLGVPSQALERPGESHPARHPPGAAVRCADGSFAGDVIYSEPQGLSRTRRPGDVKVAW